MAPTTNDTSLADRTTLNIQNRLLGLAAELRNAIYDLVLSPPDIANVFQATDTDAVYIFQTTEIVKKPALLLVSEQTRAETTSLWYGSRPSRVEVTAHTVSWFGEWAANLKDGDLVLIKHLTVIFWLEEKHLYDDEGLVDALMEFSAVFWGMVHRGLGLSVTNVQYKPEFQCGREFRREEFLREVRLFAGMLDQPEIEKLRSSS